MCVFGSDVAVNGLRYHKLVQLLGLSVLSSQGVSPTPYVMKSAWCQAYHFLSLRRSTSAFQKFVFDYLTQSCVFSNNH